MFENDLSIDGVFQLPYFLWRANATLPVLDFAPIISHVYPLDKIKQAFDDQIKGRVMKALIKP